MNTKLIALLLLLTLSLVHGHRVLLTWDPNPEADIAGYRIWYGTNSRVYPFIIDVGNVTNTIVTNLAGGLTWYFAATAYNTSSLESDLSEEVSLTIPVSKPTPPQNLTAHEE